MTGRQRLYRVRKLRALIPTLSGHDQLHAINLRYWLENGDENRAMLDEIEHLVMERKKDWIQKELI